ncbi:MAG: sirohydrochlorin cobaltochelatase [Bacteroidaceae bacterium]|nr:sirohydrochlorin cobaltochelatase [Bacteroidaceae bacterium]
MKKIKYLMMAAVAIAMSLNMSSCKDDEETTTSYNETKFQQEVTEYVKKNKTKDGAILIVAFGSTWEQAFDTFEKVKADYKAKFGNKWDIYLGFSSAICINNAYGDGKDGENGASVTYYDPEHWLNAIGLAGYKQIVVQSLQVIPGEEYRNVRDLFVKNFMNNRGQRFTKEYMKSLDRNVVIGTPLMAEEEDAQELADVLHEESDVKSALAEGIVAFMGHGNPEGYDYYGGNIRYVQLEQALRDKSKNYYVGTVDMDQTLVDDVLENIKGRSFTYEVGTVEVPVNYEANPAAKAQLFVLMSISGDHAHNDMADDEDEESWFSMFNAAGIKTAAYEKNFKEPCWKNTAEIQEKGYIPGLAERSAVRKLWMKHTEEAIQKLGTEEALSTPTTEPEEE